MKSVMAFVSYYYMSACSEIAVVDVDLSWCTYSKPSLESLIITFFSVQDKPDSKEIDEMEEVVMLKFDDNFDGKINLEEVCSLKNCTAVTISQELLVNQPGALYKT